MDEVIQKLLELLTTSHEDAFETEFAAIKNENPDAEDLEEYTFDAYNTWEWEPAFETWCASRSEGRGYIVCLELLFEALGKPNSELHAALHEAFEEGRKEALKKVESGESEWLEEVW